MAKRRFLPTLTDDELLTLLHQKHWDEYLSVTAIAAELGVSTDTIYRYCKHLDIPTRNSSEANRIRFVLASPEERKAITASANKARRGSHSSEKELITRACGKQERGMSKWEKWFAKWLIDAGITGFIHNYAIGIFNVDFAFPASKIAIEIDGGGWHSAERKRLQDEKKAAFLTQEGWEIHRVSSNGWKNKATEYTYTFKRKASEVIELIQSRVGR